MKELYFGAAALGVVVSTLAIIVTTDPLSPSASTSSRKPRSSRSSSSRHKHSRRKHDCIYEEDENGNDSTHLKPPRSANRRSSTSSHSDDDTRSDISASTDLTVYSDDGHPSVSRSTRSTRSNRSRRTSCASIAVSEVDEEARRELEEKLRAMQEQLEYARGQQVEMIADYETKVAHVQADVERWQRETERKWKNEVENRMKDMYDSKLVVANEELSRLKKQCALLNREVHKERAKNQTLSDTASIRSRSSTFSLRSRRESLAPASP